MKVKITYILAILFLVFAIFQWNDPDPWNWVITYFYVAFVCGFYTRINLKFQIIGLVFFLYNTAGYIPEILQWINDGMPSVTTSMKAKSPYIEMIREAGGLMISSFVLVVLAYNSIGTKNAK